MNRLTSILQGLGIGARALLDRHHPILAQVVPIRRCNLACGYCNEYDKVSPPVRPSWSAAGSPSSPSSRPRS